MKCTEEIKVESGGQQVGYSVKTVTSLCEV